MIDFKQTIAELLSAHIDDMSTEEIYDTIEYPKHEDMGDYAFPCFKLAKVFRKAPNMISADLVESIGNHEYFENIEAVGPTLISKLIRPFLPSQFLKQLPKKGTHLEQQILVTTRI